MQKGLDHRGIVLNFVTGALAHLQARRAYPWQVALGVEDGAGDTCGFAGASGVKRYFAAAVGMGMSELKMSHWVFHVPFNFFETFIHLPWSTWEPSAPVITYVPVP